MTKPIPTFGFIDEPQFRTPDNRARLANAMRHYRYARKASGARQYHLVRMSPGRYLVTLDYPGAPTAEIITR